VPVFHSYVNEDGYYITARPSDAGNVTYQTSPEADQLLVELDYGDEDQLPWGIINPLRAADLIYTNNQGVDDARENAPGLDPSKLSEMTDGEARKLMNYFESRGDISDEIYDQLQEKIESSSEDMLHKVCEKFHSKFPNDQTHIKIIWTSGEHDEISRIKVDIKNRGITHHISMGNDPVIDEWIVDHSYENNWEGTAKAYETRPKIMKGLGDIDSDLPFEIEWFSAGNGGSMI
jgi:hypothetical protein